MTKIYTQDDLDRIVQAAVDYASQKAAQEARAVALEEAAQTLRAWADSLTKHGYKETPPTVMICADTILALIGKPAAEALAERDAQTMQIILDDIGYTFDQLGEEARKKLAAIRARGETKKAPGDYAEGQLSAAQRHRAVKSARRRCHMPRCSTSRMM